LPACGSIRTVKTLIRIDRRRRPAPRILHSPKFGASRAQAEEHFARELPTLRQRRFAFEPIFRERTVREALVELFHGKCAFCESPVLATGSTEGRRFRPPQEAVGANGDISWPHYWWLAYEWDNLYLTCALCNRSAGSRFPVRGARAPVGATDIALREQERALLLDPCWDDPDSHLAFDEPGFVAPLTEVGRHTIDVFDLNRKSLVSARREAVQIASTMQRLEPRHVSELLNDPDRSYLAAMRQVCGRPTTALAQEPPAEQARSHWLWSHEVEHAFMELRRHPIQPLEIEQIEIRDFRGIERITLDFARDDSDALVTDPRWGSADGVQPGRWTMLLGENGNGKTTILHAVALALMGSAARKRLKAPVRDWVRRGADRAEITVHTRGAIEPRVLRLYRESGRFEIEGDDTPAVLAAYGASRIPSPIDRGRLQRRYRVRPRVESLFDPHAELMPSRRWLQSLDEPAFDFAARALLQLTLQHEAALVARTDTDVILERPQGRISLDQLSDGYRAMIVLAVDLMSVFHMRYGSMDAAEGIVLIDEIGAHLHPRWQMRIVDSFRTAFPRVQVIATTHDPLCLRGMADREVVVLRRTRDERVYVLPEEEVPPVRGLRVDELLTSEVFGLDSTVDTRLDEAFDRYYELLASDDRGAGAADEIAELRAFLDLHRQFGTTRRERLALQAADEFVSREGDVVDLSARRALSDDTRARLQAIWAGDEA
jgi:energy-coupling factor transporter ATP-binding protein EcfA2